MGPSNLRAVAAIALTGATLACSEPPAHDPEPATSQAALTVETSVRDERRWRHTATLLDDGTVLIAGGIQIDSDPPEPSSSAWLYVPGQPDPELLPDLTTPRYGHTATRLLDGSVLFAGGFDEVDEPIAAAELFLPASRTFEPVSPMISPRGEHLATLLSDGSVLMVDTEAVTVEAYDPTEQAFFSLGTRGAGARQAAVTLSDGEVLLLGSESTEQELFDPSNDRFAPLEPGMILPADLGRVTAAVRLVDGRLGVFGTQSFVRVDSRESCEGGQSVCDGRCVNLGADPENCGGCGRECGEGQICSGSACRCPGYAETCSEDQIFCGDGGCSASCPDQYAAFTRCGDRCVETSRDGAHCGACGNACADYETCSAGTCVCTRTRCGAACVDTFADSDNCGDCGIVCDNGQACFNGACRPCPGTLVHCGTRCVDPQSDPKNCGGCGTECAPGELCLAGRCGGQCPPEQLLCTNSTPPGCKTVAADPENCSVCGNYCGSGACWAKTCLPPGWGDPGAVPLATTLAAGAVWTTVNSAAYALPDDSFHWQERQLDSLPFSASAVFGGPGHTATALPDGSLLTVGGAGADYVVRHHPPWQPIYETPGFLLDPISVLLPDGRTLVLARENSNAAEVPHITSASVDMVPRTAAIQSTGEVLVVGTALDGAPTAKLVAPDLTDVTTLDVPLSIGVSGLAVGEAIVMAVPDALEVIRPSRRAGEFELERISAELDCARPALARLANGRVLIVGSSTAYVLDVRSLELSDPVALKQPRCRGGIIVRPGGALIVGGARGTSGEGAASITVEAYDIRTHETEVQNLIGTTLLDVSTIPWFDRPLVFTASGQAFRLNSELAEFELVSLPSITGAPRLLADGSLLGVFDAEFLVRVGLGPRARHDSFSTAPSLRMNTDVDFDDVFRDSVFPGGAPEGSTGTTQSSPTNVPIPVWFPAEGGWPLVGTLRRVGSRDVYHVPRTPFPGLGLMFLSTNGTLTGYGPVVIEPSTDGTECIEAGECASGFCVDSVCCDTACDGTCIACSNAEKGDGEDGVCEPVTAGTIDDACDVDDVATCDQDGTCDGRGECAMYPDGTECQPGFECSNSACVPRPTGEGGAGPGNDGGTDDKYPRCDGETRLEREDGTLAEDCDPYRCPLGADQCLESCETNRDCVGGYACSASGKCEKALDVTRLEGCGCRLESRHRGGMSAWALGLSAFLWLGRRSWRRRATRARLG